MSTERTPLISIIIPAWNSQRTIARAISSIVTNSDQPFEVIVVDDGSTDATYETAIQAMQDSGIENGFVLQQRNSGPGAARNTGARSAKGRYLALLDADDFWFEWTLNTCLEVLSEFEVSDAQPALIFLKNIDFSVDDIPENLPCAPTKIKIFDNFLEAATQMNQVRFASCNSLISRDVFFGIGGFNQSELCSEDTDIFLRVPLIHSCAVVQRPYLVAHETGSSTNLTSNFKRVENGLNFLFSQKALGKYPEAQNIQISRRRFFASSTAYTIKTAFASGNIGAAYMLYVRHFGTLVKGKNWHWLLRLPILPLLHLIRPNNFSFRGRKQH